MAVGVGGDVTGAVMDGELFTVVVALPKANYASSANTKIKPYPNEPGLLRPISSATTRFSESCSRSFSVAIVVYSLTVLLGVQRYVFAMVPIFLTRMPSRLK